MLEVRLNLWEVSAVGLLLPVGAAFLLTGTPAEELFPRAIRLDVVWLILLGLAPGQLARLSTRVETDRAIPYFAGVAMILTSTERARGARLRELMRLAPRAAPRGSSLAHFRRLWWSRWWGTPGTGGLQVIAIACGAMTIALFAIGFPMAKWRMGATSSGSAVEGADGPELDGRAGEREEFSQCGRGGFRKSGPAGWMSMIGTSGAGGLRSVIDRPELPRERTVGKIGWIGDCRVAPVS